MKKKKERTCLFIHRNRFLFVVTFVGKNKGFDAEFAVGMVFRQGIVGENSSVQIQANLSELWVDRVIRVIRVMVIWED